MSGENTLLIVYVVWHPDFAGGQDLAEYLFKQLCSDPEHPASRGLGIPVRFRTGTTDELPPPIDFAAAANTVVVVLVDDEMVAAPRWDAYVEDLLERRRPGRTDRVIPVGLSSTSMDLSEHVAQTQFVRLWDQSADLIPLLLVSSIMDSLCRLLSTDHTKKIQVFISHAKEDGVDIARTVQRYLHETAGLADFFDATDIGHGSTFKEAIENALGDSAVLLAVQTDGYASREWCRLEVLDAKRLRLSIVVLAAVKNGEVRSFPYIGNVPVVRWVDESSLLNIIHSLLREVLRREWFPAHMAALCTRAGITLEEGDAYTYPPELLTALLLRAERGGTQPSRYLYPDPPLGTEELRLLETLDPHLLPITPTELLA